MARPGSSTVDADRASPVERSTYVLAASAVSLVFWQWRPIGAVIWKVEKPRSPTVLRDLWVGWAVVLTTRYLINHFELFGLPQVALLIC